MKKGFCIALCGLILTLGTGAAWSEPPDSSRGEGWFQQRRSGKRGERMQRFDTNGDGQLDEGERQAAREQMKGKHKERFAKFDTNGDGQLDEGERQAAREQMKGKHKERFAKFDTNGDGQLDEGERQAMREQMIQRFDKNGNGRIDPEERPQQGRHRRHRAEGEQRPAR